MRVTMPLNANVLIYDDAHPQCSIRVVRSQEHLFAFIQCVVMDMDGVVTGTKRHWGLFEFDSEEHVRFIMAIGGEWDDNGPR